MTEHKEQLSKDDFALKPLVEDSMSLLKYMQELNDNPERNDTAPALVLRCLTDMGIEKPEDYPKDSEMRLYLEMLREQGIVSFKALSRVAGSQRFQAQIASSLSNAAANGAQLYQMLVVEGGTGSGKDLFKDGIIDALVKHAKVYAVKGCPEHENPLNLLKMDEITPEMLKVFAEKSGLGDRLYEMLRTAVSPCQCCHKKVMGDIDHPTASPNLADIEVEVIRLSNYTGGIQEWKPGQDTPLEKALRKAQRGFVSMNDGFLKIAAEQGKADQRLILLDVPQYRRLPGVHEDGCVDPPAPSPFDAVIFFSTNAKAMSEWLDTIPDKEAFTSRCILLKLPYNLVRVEEERAYMEVMAGYREVAHFDPLALKLIATLAVLSRFKPPERNDLFVHPMEKLRLYQGEKIKVKPLESSRWAEFWSSGGSYSSYSSSSSSSSSNKNEDAVKLTGDAQVSPGLLWKVAGADEGLTGLDMRFMLGLLSSINSLALKGKHKCISAQQVLQILTIAISNKLNNSNQTKEQKETYERCLKWLGSQRGYNTASNFGGTKPELIESEYRRLLKDQFVRVFSPEYEKQAQQLYEDYKLHALAHSEGKPTARHPLYGPIPVNERLLDELDRYRLGKLQTDGLTTEDKKFRGSGLMLALDDARSRFLLQAKEQLAATKPDNDEEDERPLPKFEDNWQTIPELAIAIAAKLDAGISETIEKLLMTEVDSNLSEEEQEQKQAAIKQLKSIGYCDGCLKPVLEYAKRTTVWSYKG